MATATFMLTNKDNFETRTKFTGVRPIINMHEDPEEGEPTNSDEPGIL